MELIASFKARLLDVASIEGRWKETNSPKKVMFKAKTNFRKCKVVIRIR